MGDILSLEPEGIEKRVHPRALEHFRKFQANVRFAVPLEELTEADLTDYLRDDEISEFRHHLNRIADELRACTDIGDGDLLDNQVKVLHFEFGTITAMFSVKQLLEKVYDRKVKSIKEELKKKEEQERQQVAKAKEEREQQAVKAEEERKKKEEDERWSAAYEALKTPTAAAKRYLTELKNDSNSIFSLCQRILFLRALMQAKGM